MPEFLESLYSLDSESTGNAMNCALGYIDGLLDREAYDKARKMMKAVDPNKLSVDTLALILTATAQFELKDDWDALFARVKPVMVERIGEDGVKEALFGVI